MTANPPQSRAPPGTPPPAQGATSDQASCRLQIRSALSPPAGSGDPPSEPSIPARLRAAAPQPEGPEPPSIGSRGQLAPVLRPHHPSCYSRSGGAEASVPCVPTRRLLVSSRVSDSMHPGVASCMPLALRCPLSRPTLPRLASAQSLTLARPLSHNERASISEVTRISLERPYPRRSRPPPLDLGATISYLPFTVQALEVPTFAH